MIKQPITIMIDPKNKQVLFLYSNDNHTEYDYQGFEDLKEILNEEIEEALV